MDEDRATLQPGIEASIAGDRLSAGDIQADLAQLDQPAPWESAGRLAQDGRGGWTLDGNAVWFASDATKGAAAAAAVAADSAVVVSGVRLRSGLVIAETLRPATAEETATLPRNDGRGVWWRGSPGSGRSASSTA